ncbi:MAG: EamA family transporter [Candidatus Obscuribacterales bacterium]|nr:EamA family transporter [Candidatus Obscuribacterales bacterium]
MEAPDHSLFKKEDKVNSFKILLSFALVYIIWGSTYIAIKFALQSFQPFFMGGIRFTFAGLLMCLVAIFRGERPPQMKELVSATILGTLLLVFGSTGVALAEKTVATGLVSLLVTSVPIYIVLLQWLFSGKRPSGKTWLGLFMGIVGLSLLLDLDSLDKDGEVDLFGATCVLVGAFGSACGAIYTRKAVNHPSQVYSVGMQMLAAGLILFVLSFLTGESGHSWSALANAKGEAWLALAYLAVFGSIVAFSAYVYLLQNVTPSRVATYAYVNPIVAVFLGWLWNGEALTPRVLLSGLTVLFAVWLINTARRA